MKYYKDTDLASEAVEIYEDIERRTVTEETTPTI